MAAVSSFSFGAGLVIEIKRFAGFIGSKDFSHGQALRLFGVSELFGGTDDRW